MTLSLEAIFRQAEQLLKKNSLNQAISLFKKIIELQPSHLPTLITLGNIFHQNRNLDKAKYYYEKALLIDTENSQLILNIAIIFFKLNDFKNSLFNFNKIVRKNPNLKYLRYNLTNVMRSKKILDLKKNNKELVQDLFLFLFKGDNIDHSSISNNALFFLYNKDELKELNIEESILEKNFIKNLIVKDLFQLILQKSIVTESNIEKTLTKIRREFLLKKKDENFLEINNYKNFLISLAEQCWLNEYIWFETEDEIKEVKILKDKIEKDKQINELEIAILASYLPLETLNTIKTKLKDYKSDNLYFNDLISLQIKEPLKEEDLRKSIKSIKEISNKISKEVRDQYEQNPYPRWRYCNQLSSINLEHDINYQIRPNRINFEKKNEDVDILLAGCGTGKHLISLGKYKNSNILAIDLSLSSLAYAKRKVNEFNYNNIHFLHADILDLKLLDKKFDIVESVGTLHHMENPEEGLKSLLKILKPNGLLRLGLYSETARKDIVYLREVIKDKNYKPNIEDIRAIREYVLSQNQSNNLFDSIFTQDFYSTSMIRDLLFHVQEYRYTIPKLIQTFKDFKLEFLGFSIANDFIKFQYSKIFPNDKKMTNLENWHEFEVKYPGTFLGMYQFYVRKEYENN